MNKENFEQGDIKVTLKVDIKAVEAALNNSESFQNAQIPMDVVDPMDLRLKQDIYGIHLLPITYKPGTKVPKEPNTVKSPSLSVIRVSNLSDTVREGYVTVNGNIDLPLATGKVVKLEEVYVTDEEVARAICRSIAKIQLNRGAELKERLDQEEEFINKQIDNDRW